MEFEIIEYGIFALCLFGCSYTSFTLGKRLGIDITIDYFEKEGILNLEEESNEND